MRIVVDIERRDLFCIFKGACFEQPAYCNIRSLEGFGRSRALSLFSLTIIAAGRSDCAHFTLYEITCSRFNLCNSFMIPSNARAPRTGYLPTGLRSG